MIKFRQKDYSGKSMRLLRGFKKAANTADTAIINGSLKIQDKLGLSNGRIPSSVKVSPKSNRQINKETIKTVREAQETGKKILTTPLNEGLDVGLKYAAGNPLTAVGQVSPIPGTGLAARVVEGGMKQGNPAYKRMTDKLQEGYAKSKFSRKLRRFRLPSLEEIPPLL